MIFGKRLPVLLMNKNKKLKGNSWLAVTFALKSINYKRVMSEMNKKHKQNLIKAHGNESLITTL
jgi:uncharacterized protein YrrD